MKSIILKSKFILGALAAIALIGLALPAQAQTLTQFTFASNNVALSSQVTNPITTTGITVGGQTTLIVQVNAQTMYTNAGAERGMTNLFYFEGSVDGTNWNGTPAGRGPAALLVSLPVSTAQGVVNSNVTYATVTNLTVSGYQYLRLQSVTNLSTNAICTNMSVFGYFK